MKKSAGVGHIFLFLARWCLFFWVIPPFLSAARELGRALWDGTLKELFTYGRFDSVRFRDRVEVFNRRFLKLISRKLNTKTIDDYDAVLMNPEAWAEFERNNIDCYFTDQIDMFPDPNAFSDVEHTEAAVQTLKKKTAVLKKRTAGDFEAPPDFFRVQERMIERRFPGGLNGQIGDQDLRNLISSLRYIYKSNFASLVWKRRMAMIGAELLTLAGFGLVFVALALPVWYSHSLALPEPGSSPDVLRTYWPFMICGGAALVCTVGLLIWIGWLFDDLTRDFDTTIELSAGNISEALTMRIQNCVAIIENIFSKIDRLKMEYYRLDKLKEWPREAKKWVKLAFWISYRVEYIDQYTLLQMWLIARSRMGVRAMGRFASYVVYYVFSILSAWGLYSAGEFMLQSHPALYTSYGYYAAAALAGYFLVGRLVNWRIAYKTLRSGVPSFDKIRDIVSTDSRMSFKDTNILNVLAQFIEDSKTSQLYDEDRFSGGRPKN